MEPRALTLNTIENIATESQNTFVM